MGALVPGSVEDMKNDFVAKKTEFLRGNRAFADRVSQVSDAFKKLELTPLIGPLTDNGRNFVSNFLTEAERELVATGNMGNTAAGAAFDAVRFGDPFGKGEVFEGRSDDSNAYEQLIEFYDKSIPDYEKKADLLKNILDKLVAEFGAKNEELLNEILDTQPESVDSER